MSIEPTKAELLSASVVESLSQTARRRTGKLHAVLGRFHLGPAPQDYVDHTIVELEQLWPDVFRRLSAARRPIYRPDP